MPSYTLTDALRTKLIKINDECVSLAERVLTKNYGIPAKELNIKVTFDLRSTTKYGQYRMLSKEINMNMKVLTADPSGACYRDTFLHELGHALVDLIWSKRLDSVSMRLMEHHGKEWLEVMAALGQPNATVTTSMKEYGIDREKLFGEMTVKHTCGATIRFTKRQISALKDGQRYRCRNCDEVITKTILPRGRQNPVGSPTEPDDETSDVLWNPTIEISPDDETSDVLWS